MLDVTCGQLFESDDAQIISGAEGERIFLEAKKQFGGWKERTSRFCFIESSRFQIDIMFLFWKSYEIGILHNQNEGDALIPVTWNEKSKNFTTEECDVLMSNLQACFYKSKLVSTLFYVNVSLIFSQSLVKSGHIKMFRAILCI